jgi:transcriptional regulator with XRE-family HTH domain
MATQYKQGEKINDERYVQIRSELCVQIGRRISELRSQIPETQQEFADRMGCSLNYIQRVEIGQKTLSLLSLIKFADHLNVQVADLFEQPLSNKPSVGRPKKK